MKIKNEVLVNSVQVLRKLNNAELPVKVSYKLAKNIKSIEKELNIYEEEKQKLINKYGEKDEEGKLKTKEDGSINITDTENWNKDIKELLDIEAEINIEKINIDELAKSDLKLTPSELTLIDYMIK
jgi:hypothetical protein